MSTPAQMTDDDFVLLHIERDAGVAFATIDAPPINVMTPALFRELAKFSTHVADDDSVRVVVLRSDNPDFFIAHFDVTAILGYPTDGEAERPTEHAGFHDMCERYRTMAKATIVEIGGRVGGGGSELSMSCDMRFGAIDRTVINQMEVPIGILPGGTGTQRLPRLVGRGRAMEVIRRRRLDARRPRQVGYLKPAAASRRAGGLRDWRGLPHREVPAPCGRAAKQAVNAADELPLREGLFEERYLFQRLLRTPQAMPAMEQFIELGGQTREGEMRVADLTGEISTEG